METWIFIVFLLAAAVQDLLWKKVDLWIFYLFGALGLVLSGRRLLGAEAGELILDRLLGAAPGAVLLGVSAASGGRIGAGDGMFFLVCGLLLGFWKNLSLLCCATFFCGLFSLGVLVWGQLRGRYTGRCEIPFLPFAAVPGIFMALRELAAAPMR